MSSTLHVVYFSATGTTRLVASLIADGFGGTAEVHDLLHRPQTAPVLLGEDDTLLLAMPVYAGLIPHLCIDQVRQFRGTDTPALAVAVYGNRDYDDALLQMTDLLTEGGFQVIGAGAFVAQHSIFPKVGMGRPDELDRAVIRGFAKDSRTLRDHPAVWKGKQLPVKGDPGYRSKVAQEAHIPFHPTGGRDCTACGACASVCPTHSIDTADPKGVRSDTCISCGACISVCPHHCRGYHSVAYPPAALAFGAKCASRRDSEIFLLG